jgi:purine nucleosidase/pyrimidine-specific ribonucleoside hydrolase
MKRKGLVTLGIVVGVLVLLFIILVPAAPLWVKLGVKPICIEGDWPKLKIVSCPSAVRVAVTPLPLPILSGGAPIPIIVDDDGSPDGMIALLYFLRNPMFAVKAVTVSCGEAHPEVFANHISQLLAGFGRADIPVGAGRNTPLEGSNAFPEPWRMVSDLFWDIPIPPAAGATMPVPAAQLIVDILNVSTQPVMVFLSGTHTNLAEALRLEPGIAAHIRNVYIMGGSMYVPGNIHSDWSEIENTVAEWNIWVDPLAASDVFKSGAELHITPLDATQKVLWTQSDVSGWAASGSKEGRMAQKVLQWMLASWSPSGVYIWDLVTAVNATNPAICPETRLAVDINTAPGPEQGQTVVTDKSPNASVCLNPDSEQVKLLAASILGR